MNIIKKIFRKKIKFDLFLEEEIRLFSSMRIEESSQENLDWGIFDYDFSDIFSNYNVGDGIQSLAVKNLKKNINPLTNEIFLDRENISFYKGKQLLLIMQGYFSHTKFFLPQYPILPIFIGTHLNKNARIVIKKLVQLNPNYFKNIEVGCRDIATRDFFQSIGISSYFSRCLTLTFPLRNKKIKGQSVFIVDLPSKLFKYIPKEIRKNAKLNKQRAVPYSLYSTIEKRMAYAQDILNLYRDEASLVITSALHCAQPCIAMGIPVIFIDPEESSERFSTLRGIIPIYTKEDLIHKRIDFYNVTVPNIEYLKKLMIENLKLSIEQIKGNKNNDNITNLQNIRTNIASFKA